MNVVCRFTRFFLLFLYSSALAADVNARFFMFRVNRGDARMAEAA